MREIRIGILGFGIVGSGVVEGLLKNKNLIADRCGIIPIIGKIVDRDIEHDRGISSTKELLTTSAESVINDNSIDIIVELIGGTTIAKKYVEAALRLGKPVVTANKALLADYGAELFTLANQYDTGIYYEASVGGGIPIIRSQRDGLIANQIEEIFGILNGTCNYILTRMEKEGLSYGEVLLDAQKLGYAETPPDLDIDGVDTAHKAVILASMAFGSSISMSNCSILGIRGISQVDIKNSSELGYRIKLLSIIKNKNNLIELTVEPVLVPKSHMIGSVSDSFNAVFIKGDIVGDTMYYGRGAGKLPTGSAVIGDIMEAAADILDNRGSPSSVSVMIQNNHLNYISSKDVLKRCYLRLSLSDEPGAMGQVMSSFGENNINIASVLQKEIHPNGVVPVIILTELAKESDFINAVSKINSLNILQEKVIRFRLEDFDDESS